MGFAIRSRRVLLREQGRLVVRPAVIHVAGAQIARVEAGEAGEAPPGEHDESVIELGNHLLTPAFVNAHTHLALAFLRGVTARGNAQNLVEDVFFHYESKLSPGDIRAFTRMGAYESLLAGVGAVWDHYYGGTALADGLADVGLAGVVAPTLQDLEGPGRDGSEAAIAATLEIAGSERYRERGILAALGPHATDTVSPALFTRIAELAETHALPVHVHLAQSIDELRRVHAREGCSPFELLARAGVLSRAPALVAAHGLFVPRADLARFRANHALVLCPSSQLEFGFLAPAHVWSEERVRWVVATDCAASNDSMGLQKELRMARGVASAALTGSHAYEQFLASEKLEAAEQTARLRSERRSAFLPHVTAEALLERVLYGPGELHPALRMGSLEQGALASFVAWDTDHPSFWPAQDVLHGLALGDTTAAIHALFVAGRPVGRIGDVARSLVDSDDYREARREATERLDHLLDG
jgi:cytosine/adenosine deaminase-related metal-dependent hydrolase